MKKNALIASQSGPTHGPKTKTTLSPAHGQRFLVSCRPSLCAVLRTVGHRHAEVHDDAATGRGGAAAAVAPPGAAQVRYRSQGILALGCFGRRVENERRRKASRFCFRFQNPNPSSASSIPLLPRTPPITGATKSQNLNPNSNGSHIHQFLRCPLATPIPTGQYLRLGTRGRTERRPPGRLANRRARCRLSANRAEKNSVRFESHPHLQSMPTAGRLRFCSARRHTAPTVSSATRRPSTRAAMRPRP
jgi:hypothetical protein